MDIKVLTTDVELEVQEATPSGAVVLVGDEGDEGSEAALSIGLVLSQEAAATVLGKLSDRPDGDIFDAKVFILVGDKETLEGAAWDVIADRLAGGRG